MAKQSGNSKQDASHQLEADIARLREDLQRAQADLINYRNRVEREKTELLEYAKGQVIRELLPLIDNLDRALNHMPKELAKNEWAQGVTRVGKQVKDALKGVGVEPIETKGSEFDPNLHEAVSVEGNGVKEMVSEELQTGYRLGDEVLRPAIVKVRRQK